MRFGVAMTAMSLGLSVLTGSSFAQEGPGGPPPPGGQQGGGGGGGGDRGGDRPRFDPAQFRQRMMDRIKEELKAPDDEWAVLQPKIEKVMEAQRTARAGEFGGGFGRGGGPGGGGPGGNRDRQGGGQGGQQGGPGGQQPPQGEVGKAAADLRTAVRSENPSEQDIEAKLTALRAAREKANADLKTARQELKEVLTVQQEAVLVLTGMLE